MPRSGYVVVARGGGSNAAERLGGSLYPGTNDLWARRPLTSAQQRPRRSSNSALTRQRLYAVRGRVAGLNGGPPPREASVWITTTSLMGGETITAMPT